MNSFKFVIPVYNDWTSLKKLVQSIDDILIEDNNNYDIIIVDDGSTLKHEKFLTFKKLKSIDEIAVLELYSNLGHQRSIAIGLSYINELKSNDYTIILDGDGEDRPESIIPLIEQAKKEQKIVFAKRTKRYDSTIFKISYIFYKIIFKLFTGRSICGGNFSVIPKHILPKILTVSDLWNHYHASVLKSGLPYSTLLTSRGKRIDGKSKLGFGGLIMHACRSIAVFSENVGLRILLFSISISLGSTLCSILFVINGMLSKVFTELLITLNISIYVFNGMIFFHYLTILNRRNHFKSPLSFSYQDYVKKVYKLSF